MSLRSSRSWMPARKSWASRIIGLRLVRAIAVSTSISTLASVALHDLDQHRVGAGAGVVGEEAEREVGRDSAAHAVTVLARVTTRLREGVDVGR